MDDSVAVRGIERAGDLGTVAEDEIDRKRSLLQSVGQRLAFDQLHYQKVGAVVMADVEERADVRVVELGDRPGLALEPRLELGIRGEAGGEDLDRDVALQTGVPGAPDLSHTPRAEGRDDLVGTKAETWRGTHLNWTSARIVARPPGRLMGIPLSLGGLFGQTSPTGMRRPTIRVVASIVLALLGAPVAMHVVLHDLHHDDERHHHHAAASPAAHGEHDHPVLSAGAPRLPAFPRAAAVTVTPPAAPAVQPRTFQARRNLIAHGAVRLDDDVGLQTLLSTFLI